MQEHEEQDLSPWWRRWLLGEGDAPPELAEFEEPVADEEQAHVVLRDLSNQQYNALVKLQADLPPELSNALVLRASRTRAYPMARAAAHVIGRLAEVGPDDVRDDPELADELRRYLPGDLAGRTGLERLAERELRGTRGRIDIDLEHDARDIASDPIDGGEVRTTLDLGLSKAIAKAFERVEFRWPEAYEREPLEHRIVRSPMPGAAVVIDVETGGVRAMVSYPDFDLNTFADDAANLYADELNRPTLNRATLFATVPGSTVKPIVGLGAISDGLLSYDEPIECDGHLHVVVDGKLRTYTTVGRCWTMKMFGNLAFLQRHQGGSDPHPTPALHPHARLPAPGMMTFADAVQRSCNIYFETPGHRGGEAQLASWLGDFGLGSVTGVGLPERGGLLPDEPDYRGMERIRNNWFAAIGQGPVLATPMQMAVAAATLARGGVRVRPTLLEKDAAIALQEAVDLELDDEAVAAARRGMWAVVNTPGGSGHRLNERLPLEIGGKTGSAQADVLTIVDRDEDGQPILNEAGRPTYRRLSDPADLSIRGRPNPLVPWYRRTNQPTDPTIEVTHAWFIGYAPADEPKYAFAVFVEYGGSGGYAAGSVAVDVVRALVEHDYLTPTRELSPEADPENPTYVVNPHPPSH